MLLYQGSKGSRMQTSSSNCQKLQNLLCEYSTLFSKTARRTFATLAVGKSKEMQLEFYADLRDDSQSPSSNYNCADDDNIGYKRSPSTMEDNHSITCLEETMDTETSGEQTTEEQLQQSELDEYIEVYREKLKDITNDNYVAEVGKWRW
jgi:hypothetical protein